MRQSYRLAGPFPETRETFLPPGAEINGIEAEPEARCAPHQDRQRKEDGHKGKIQAIADQGLRRSSNVLPI